MASERIPIETLLGLPFLGGGTVSPTDEYVAYYTDTSGQYELYLRDCDTDEEQQLTNGELSQQHRPPIMWGTNGETIYVHREADQPLSYDVYAVGLDGEMKSVVCHEGRCIVTDESPDGRYLLVIVDQVESPMLGRYDRQSGAFERLTPEDYHVWPAGFSPSGDEIAYQANDVQNLEDVHVVVANADGTDAKRLDIGDPDANSYFRRWHPTQRKLLIGDETTDRRRCGIYDLDAEEVEWFGTGQYVEYPRAVLPDGTGILALRFTEMGTAVVPVVYFRDGRERELSLTNGRMHDNPWATDDLWFADGDLLAKYETSTTRTAFYRYDTGTDECETVVKAEYGGLDPDQFVDPELVTYESSNDTEIGALLYDSGERPSPAVVWVHGGPQQHEQRDFDIRTQVLVNRGYTVLKPNYRGSTGRGRVFREALNGAWGDVDVADVRTGGQWLKQRSWVDEDRVAIFGNSYGGYHVCVQLVKHPAFWTAGIEWNGYHGWGGEESEAYRPLDHFEDIEQPLLMLHGVDDHPSIEHGRRLREALEECGLTGGDDFEYRELEDEGHYGMETEQRSRRLRLVEDFLNRWI